MAKRYEIGEVVQAPGTTNPYLRAVAGRSVTINDLRGQPLTVYSAEAGAGTIPQPLLTDANGRIEGYLEAPDYDVVVSGPNGYTQPIRRTQGGHHVKSYGAKGIAGDDTAAFQAAIAAAKADGSGNPRIFVSGGEYGIFAQLDVSGLVIEGVLAAPGVPALAPNPNPSIVILRHHFNGDMLFLTGAAGCLLRNLYLYQDNAVAYTGAALKAVSDAVNNIGDVTLENVTISGGGGWERDLVIDGSAHAIGARKIRLIDCELFGCFTPGETVLLKRVVHLSMVGFSIVQAPAAVQQGIKILDAFSSAIEINGYVLGDFYTEASDNVDFTGTITGSITCAAGSMFNRFRGRLASEANASIVDAGTDNKFTKTPTPTAHVTLNANETIPNNVLTFIPWDVEVLDKDKNAGLGMVDLAADNNSIFARTPGEYLVTLRLTFAANAAGLRVVQLLHNGNVFAADERNAVNGGETSITLACKVRCAQGDRFRAKVLQNSGGNLDVINYGSDLYSASFEVTKVG